MRNYENGARRATYKTFPKKAAHSSGFSQRWALLRWCCPFCFESPSPSRRGSQVPVIKVTRVRTPSTDSEDSDADYDGTASPDLTEESQKQPQKVALRKGYDATPQDFTKGENNAGKTEVSSRTEAEKEGAEPHVATEASSSAKNSAFTEPDVPVNGRQAQGSSRSPVKRSSVKGIKEMFTKSKVSRKKSDKNATTDIQDDSIENVPEEQKEKRKSKFFSFKTSEEKEASRDKRSSKKSRYSIIKKKRSSSPSRSSTSKSSDSNLKESMRGSVGSADPQGSSDSDPLITDDLTGGDSLEFENLPLARNNKGEKDAKSPTASTKSSTSSSEDQSLSKKTFATEFNSKISNILDEKPKDGSSMSDNNELSGNNNNDVFANAPPKPPRVQSELSEPKEERDSKEVDSANSRDSLTLCEVSNGGEKSCFKVTIESELSEQCEKVSSQFQKSTSGRLVETEKFSDAGISDPPSVGCGSPGEGGSQHGADVFRPKKSSLKDRIAGKSGKDRLSKGSGRSDRTANAQHTYKEDGLSTGSHEDALPHIRSGYPPTHHHPHPLTTPTHHHHPPHHHPPPTSHRPPTAPSSAPNTPLHQPSTPSTVPATPKTGTPSPVIGATSSGGLASRQSSINRSGVSSVGGGGGGSLSSSLTSSMMSCGGDASSSAADEDVEKLLMFQDRKRQHSLTTLGSRSESLPSVCSGSGGYTSVAVRGEVMLALDYSYKEAALQCRVIKCRDIAAVDTKRGRSDPYVKVYLLPDKTKAGKRKTKVKKHTLNPTFDEVLKFPVALSGMASRTLWLSVWHSDMFGRNDFLGEVLVPMTEVALDDGTPRWHPLQERSESVDELPPITGGSRGELIVAMKFVPPDISGSNTSLSSVGLGGSRRGRRSKGGLYVLIKEAKNLQSNRPNGTADPVCKAVLVPEKGRSCKQKTAVCRKTLNPNWNYTMHFDDVSLQDLIERSLEIAIWDHDRLGPSQYLGGCRLNLGRGSSFGRPVEWMDATGMERLIWEHMLEKVDLWVESSIMLRSYIDRPVYPIEPTPGE